MRYGARQLLLGTLLVIAGTFCLWRCSIEQPTDDYVDHHPDIVDGAPLTVEAAESGSKRSGQWPTVRKHYLAVHPTCEACGARTDLNVHHVMPFHLDPSKELDPANLITLCRGCHLRIGHACDSDGRVNWSCSNPNVREDARKHLHANHAWPDTKGNRTK